ncbi:MAG: hypothetical protein IPM56_00490 [Ignavibacteriales bacterium]|nr:MAG: hypothetical protein IPM56_00490 [Ignavibacteriales bacterium]
MKPLFALGFLLLVLIFSCSNEKDSLIVNPPPHTPDSSLHINSLSHNSIHPGEKILVSVNNLSGADLHFVQLNGIYVYHREESDSVVSVFIPFNGASGKLKFVYSGTADTAIYSDSINVIPDCADSLCIGWNNGERITEFDSKFTSWDSTHTWDYYKNGDTSFFNISGLCGDECSITKTIAFLSNEDEQLPQFLFSAQTIRDYMGGNEVTDTLHRGILRVDNWNTNNIMSGTYSFTDYSWVFWFKNN